MKPFSPSVWVRVTRMPLAATAVCDALACGLLATQMRGVAPSNIAWTQWVLVGVTSFCLYLFGMAANDLADRERDKHNNANRPLPSGALAPRQVVVGLGVLAALALAAAWRAHTLPAAFAALLLALLYDFVVRRPWWLSAICMGLVRFANASLLVAPFVWDGSLSPWAFLAPACIGLYSTAITVWSSTEELVERLNAPVRLHLARALIVIAFGGAGALACLVGGQFALGSVIAAGVVSSTLFHRTPRARSPKKQVLELLLGLYFLAAVLAGATQDASPIWGLGALALAWLLAMGSQLWIHSLIRVGRAPSAT